jgi:hypothetical protein
MLTEHNDFGAFALTSSQGFKFDYFHEKEYVSNVPFTIVFSIY